MSTFVHLHLHSGFSLLDGACDHDTLAKTAAKYKMPAVAVTDHGNLFGAIGFYEATTKYGVKPIIGCEMYIAKTSRFDRDPASGRPYHLIVLCENERGYKNLVKLVSKGYLEGFYYKPRIDKDLLSQHSEGLIGLSACLNGEVASNVLGGRADQAERAAGEYLDIFGRDRFFLEIHNHGLEKQRKIIPDMLQISARTGIRPVATNDCHYMQQDDCRAHDILLCIQTGKTVNDPNRMKFYTDQFYFKTREEMNRVFGELPFVLDQSVEIAERCCLQLQKVQNPFPEFTVPPGYTIDTYFAKIVHDGFQDRLELLKPLAGRGLLKNPLSAYEARLEEEIRIIQGMKYSGYFLIVWDLIRYARENDIPVGPGRGSAAGSLVSYCMRITDLDPLQYGLLFERFLNPERVTLPDIDIDFCMNRRAAVIDYVTKKYGRENVSQIITFGTMAARGVIRDTGRGLEMTYAEVDRIAKLVPAELHITLEKAIDQSADLKALIQSDGRVKELIEIAKRLEGLARHASTHAAGVVISPQPLTDFVPLYKTNKDEITTMYPMMDVEKIGLLKMDFLALTTLTIIDDTLKMLKQYEGLDLNMDTVPLDDEKTYELFSAGLTDGVFQFESSGMKDILRKFKPSSIEHLTALNALYRPGPIGGGMIDDFIKRKHGVKKIEYELPELKAVLEETYGVIVYQEQVMQIANVISGYSLGEADLLRRAMGKKKAEEMAAQREKFLGGARAKGFKDEKKITRIFDLMEQFAGYGFNKSHSAAYAVLAYRTAYLKARHPQYFMAALLTSERGNQDKVVKYINECRDMGIAIQPPDIDSSDVHFTPTKDGIRFGLAAIKNVGETAITSIVASKPFESLFDFCERVDLRTVNKRVIESLVKAGAFDSIETDRSLLYANIDRAMDWGQRKQREREIGQGGLFGMITVVGNRNNGLDPADPWPEGLKLKHEKETLGFYITGHPLRKYTNEVKTYGNATTGVLSEKPSGFDVSIGGLVSAIRLMRTKKGDAMCVILLEDWEGIVEVLVFPEIYSKVQRLLEVDAPVFVRGKLDNDESSSKILATDLLPMERVKEVLSRIVTIRIDGSIAPPDLAERLQPIIDEKRGSAEVIFELKFPGRFTALVRPNPYVKISPDREFVESVERICGRNTVQLS
ncbi:MAG: DNA polymerase III subunit alpha [Acidobacteria bacterium 13_1_20CM_2_55_15]|nr:MAG: DNA polymerase III subunit alpha [Acidobacteria bacterium 13_1_20CM_2_55_15]